MNVRAVAIRIVVAGRRPVRIRRGRHAGGKQTCRDDDGGDEGADDDEGDGRYGQRGGLRFVAELACLLPTW